MDERERKIWIYRDGYSSLYVYLIVGIPKQKKLPWPGSYGQAVCPKKAGVCGSCNLLPFSIPFLIGSCCFWENNNRTQQTTSLFTLAVSILHPCYTIQYTHISASFLSCLRLAQDLRVSSASQGRILRAHVSTSVQSQCPHYGWRGSHAPNLIALSSELLYQPKYLPIPQATFLPLLSLPRSLRSPNK